MLKKVQFLLAALFVASFIVNAFPVESEGVDAVEIYSASDVSYPRGYTHRPFIAFYTSLSCPPCMANGEPTHTEYWLSNGHEKGIPVNTAVIHMTNGGAGDDALYTEESLMWYQEQHISGAPTLLVDDGYYMADTTSVTDLASGVDSAGARQGTPSGPLGIVAGEEFKVAELEVVQLFTGDSFKVKVKANYIENQGGPMFTGDNTLNGFVNVFMVEETVDAYSSELDENVTCHNAFRGFAASKESVTLQPGESWEDEFTWKVPILNPDDNKIPINTKNVFPIAVLYDSDDTTSNAANGKAGATRSINSATPMSTAYDLGTTPPKVSNLTAQLDGKRTKVSTTIESDQTIEAAYVAYTTHGPDFTGPWSIAEMNISESGEAVGYLETTETAHYQLMVYDGNWTELKTEVAVIKGEEGTKISGSMGALPLIATLAVLGVLAVIFRDKIPVLKDMFPKQEAVAVVEPVDSGESEESFVDLVDEETKP